MIRVTTQGSIVASLTSDQARALFLLMCSMERLKYSERDGNADCMDELTDEVWADLYHLYDTWEAELNE